MKAALPSPRSPGFAYTIYGGVRRYQIRSDGSFIARGQYNEGAMSAYLGVADPAGRFLYLAGSTGYGPSLFQFQIRPDGSLSHIYPDLVTKGSTSGILFSPNGRYVYVFLWGAYYPPYSSQPQSRVVQYLIKQNGALTRLTRPAVNPLGTPLMVFLTSPGGRFVYAVNYPGVSRNYRVSQYKITPSGALRPLSPPVAPLGRNVPLAVTVDGSGHVLRETVQTLREPSGVTVPARPDLIRRDRTLYLVPTARHGRFAYRLNTDQHKIAQYRVSASGRLLAMPPMVLCDPGIFMLAPSLDGDYLYGSGERRLVDRYLVPAGGRLRSLTTANITAQFEAGYLVIARPARHQSLRGGH